MEVKQRNRRSIDSPSSRKTARADNQEDEDGAAALQEDDDAELSAIDDGHRRDRSEVPAEDSDGDGDSRSACGREKRMKTESRGGPALEKDGIHTNTGSQSCLFVRKTKG